MLHLVFVTMIFVLVLVFVNKFTLFVSLDFHFRLSQHKLHRQV